MLYLSPLNSWRSDFKLSATTTEVTGSVDGVPCSSDPTVIPNLHNPLAPWFVFSYLPVFEKFGIWEGQFDEDYLVDFLGVKTNPKFDCPESTEDGMTYFAVVPSRRIPCEYHAKGKRIHAKTKAHIRGYLPPVDDEYWEFADLLESVQLASRNGESVFGVVEIGARYGTWIARGGVAFKRLRPDGIVVGVGVESHHVSLPWFREHMKVNGLHNVKLLEGYAGERDKPAEGSTPRVFSLNTILDAAETPIIHYLDTDCQGCERTLFDDQVARGKLLSRVAKVHIGSHGGDVHKHLRRLFLDKTTPFVQPATAHQGLTWSWSLRVDFHPMTNQACDAPPSLVAALQTNVECLTFTDVGPVYIRDGLLVFINNNLVPESEVINPVAGDEMQ